MQIRRVTTQKLEIFTTLSSNFTCPQYIIYRYITYKYRVRGQKIRDNDLQHRRLLQIFRSTCKRITILHGGPRELVLLGISLYIYMACLFEATARATCHATGLWKGLSLSLAGAILKRIQIDRWRIICGLFVGSRRYFWLLNRRRRRAFDSSYIYSCAVGDFENGPIWRSRFDVVIHIPRRRR